MALLTIAGGLTTQNIERRLDEPGLTLPEPLVPPGQFELVKLHGGLAYIAGHAPADGSAVLMRGLVGRDLSLEEGYEAARLTGLSILASLKRELGDLDRVTSWIRAVGYVHCEPRFDQNPAVLNGFSDLMWSCGATPAATPARPPGQGPSPSGVPIIIDAIAAVD